MTCLYDSMPRRRMRQLEALAALLLAHVVVFWLPAAVLTRVLGTAVPRTAFIPSPGELARAQLADRAIRRICRLLPWNNRCLARATALHLMLQRRAVPHTVCFGVRKNGAMIAAHAWVSVGEQMQIGQEGSSDFREIARFAEDGHAA